MLIKLMSTIICGFLAISLTSAQEMNRNADDGSMTNDATMLATNKCFSKGGLGIVNTSLFIVVHSAKSDHNALIVKPTEETEQTWGGQGVANTEIVVFYEGKVLSTEHLPDRFNISKAVVISFERDKVRFFDFQLMLGGYYDRIIR